MPQQESREAWLTQFEAQMKQASQSGVTTIREATEHIANAGGKRLRPRVAFAFAETLGASPLVAAKVGLAAELLHTASLVHDDVIDQSGLRRNREAVHVKFGVSNAILAGDFLLAKSVEVLAAENLFHAVRELSVALRKIVEAEVLQNELRYCTGSTLHDARRIAEGKTGALFAFVLRAIAAEAGFSHHQQTAAEQAGRLFGLAFQIGDDLLDVQSAAAGKPARIDLREGLLTIPLQLARAAHPPFGIAIEKAFSLRSEESFAEAYRIAERVDVSDLGNREINRCCAEGTEALAHAFSSHTTQSFSNWLENQLIERIF